MKELNFFTNWNQKLDCKAFTTLRLSDRYIVSDKIEIKLKNKPHSYGEIIAKKYFLLKDITEWIAYIDTGYSKTECQDILKKMYKNKNINWTTQNIYLYLIRKIISLFDKENKMNKEFETWISKTISESKDIQKLLEYGKHLIDLPYLVLVMWAINRSGGLWSITMGNGYVEITEVDGYTKLFTNDSELEALKEALIYIFEQEIYF